MAGQRNTDIGLFTLSSNLKRIVEQEYHTEEKEKPVQVINTCTGSMKRFIYYY
jgi:hypothetical protein